MDLSKTATELADKAIEAARSLCVRADLLDSIIVNCRLRPRREAMHCSRSGITFIKNGIVGVIPFGEKVFLPADEFNKLLLTEDSMSDKDQNPLSYDIVEFGFLREGKLCSRNGHYIASDGSVIEDEETKAETCTHWIEEDDVEKVFKVITLDKNENNHTLKKFILRDDAEKYIYSLSITSE